jgi:hypothetical protein
MRSIPHLCTQNPSNINASAKINPTPRRRAYTGATMSQRTAPLDLWRLAQYLLSVLHSAFGGPEDVAAQGAHTRKARALLLRWLRAGEAVLRHLLLIEAHNAEFAPACPRSGSRKPRARRLMHFSADKPEDWRVSFRCFVGRVPVRQAHRDAEGTGGADKSVTLSLSKGDAPRRLHSAWPLAERYEALLRAYNDPAPYARRLARRLHARPANIDRVFAQPDDLPDLIGDRDYGELTRAAQRCWPQRHDSS